jgi:hypothetical protein
MKVVVYYKSKARAKESKTKAALQIPSRVPSSIVQGSTKLSSRNHMATRFSSWYKRRVMPKKKVIVPPNLKDF